MSKFVTLHGFGGSGGSELNFEVVGGTTQPINPKENTIWVNTDVEIMSWIFSATEPTVSVEEGMVWFFNNSVRGPCDFNALENNGIQIYPLFAKQYIGGIWVNIETMSYQGGEWVQWGIVIFNGELTEAYGTLGNPNSYGWFSNSGVNYCTHYVTINNGQLELSNLRKSSSEGYDSGYVYFDKKIDVTNINKILVTCGEFTNAALSSSGTVRVGLLSSIGHNPTKVASASLIANETTILDTSSITGEYYLAIAMVFNTSSSKHILRIIDWRCLS